MVPTATERRPDRAEPGRGLRRRRAAVRRAGGAGHRAGAGPGRRLLRTGGQSGQPAGRRGQSGHGARLRRVPGRPRARRARVGFDTRALRTRHLKDIGRVQVWKLSRAGSEPGADRRRNVRWERLSEVLRELDDLRERGEQVVRGSRRTCPRPVPTPRSADRSGESVAVEAGGGDAVGPELEAAPRRGRPVGPVGRPATRSDPAISTVVAGVVRVEHPDLEATGLAPDGRHLGAPDGQGRAPVGPGRRPRTTPWSPGGRGRRRPSGRDRRRPRQGVVDRHRPDHLGTLQRRHRAGGQRAGGHAQPREHAGGPQQGEGQARWPGSARARRPRRWSTSSYSSRPSWTTVSPPLDTKRRDGKVGVPNSSGRPSAVRPRSTTVKAHSACEVAAGSGSGRWTRSRWSLDGLTNWVRTRTTGSSARTSSVVTTGTWWLPTRDLVRPRPPGRAR